MESFAQQVLALTEKVIGFILNWPFLLFVFLVWMVHRYREQIASILERRGTIKRSELSSAIREHVELLNRNVGGIKSEVASFSAKVAQLEAAQSECRLSAFLEPVNAKIAALEGSLLVVQTAVEALAKKELPERMAAELKPLSRDLNDLKAEFDGIRASAAALATRESVETLGKGVSALERDLTELRIVVPGLVSPQNLAAELEPLIRDTVALKEGLERIGAQVATVPSQDALNELGTRMESLQQDLSEMRRQLERPEPQAADSAAKERAEPRQSVAKTGEPAKAAKKRKTKG